MYEAWPDAVSEHSDIPKQRFLTIMHTISTNHSPILAWLEALRISSGLDDNCQRAVLKPVNDALLMWQWPMTYLKSPLSGWNSSIFPISSCASVL